MRKAITFSLLAIWAILLLWAALARAQSPPYSQSTAFPGITWDCASSVSAANGSDLWPTTWHSDGHLYLAWGDGFCGFSTCAFGSSLGISRIKGTPTSLDTDDVLCDDSAQCLTSPASNGINPDSWSTDSNGGKIVGILSVGTTLYGWVNMQDGTFPHVTFRLASSTDNGAHWTLDDESFPATGGSFSPSVFIQYGQAYAGGDSTYLYVLGHNKWSTLSDLQSVYMMRMPRLTITDKTTYQYFSGTPTSPQWSGDITQRQPIFTDAAHVGRTAHISYIPAIDRYLLAVSHGIGGSLTNQGIGLFESVNPWGPWATIDYQTSAWCGFFGDLSLGFSIITKTPDWLSSNGLTLTVVWSGTGAFDRYNHIQGTLLPGVNEHHVSPAGTGTACTDQAPCALATAQANASSGHAIVFHDGIYPWFDTAKPGLTFRAKNQYMAIIANQSSHTGGVYAISIRHDDTIIDGLRVTGQQTGGGSGHGLIRWFETTDTVVRNSIIEESAGGLLNICGSIGFDNCANITIEDNVLRNSGYSDEFGEGIYIGEFTGGNTVTNVLIQRNTFSGIGCEQALDVKAGGSLVEAHHNVFEGQFERNPGACGAGVDGVVVSQGELNFHDNVVRGNILGESVFRPSTNGSIIRDNSIYSNSHTGNLIRTRGAGPGSTQTEIFENVWCNNSNDTIEAVFNTHDNTTDNTGAGCTDKTNEILSGSGDLDSIPLAECK